MKRIVGNARTEANRPRVQSTVRNDQKFQKMIRDVARFMRTQEVWTQ
jgi:hypothetical protein